MRRRCARPSQGRDDVDDSVVRWKIELVSHSRFINSRTLQRPCAITARNETREQSTDRFRIEWIVICQTFEPSSFSRNIPCCVRSIGENDQRVAVLSRESRSLRRKPELEFRATI